MPVLQWCYYRYYQEGRTGGAKVSYNMYYGQSSPGEGWDLLNSQEMADLTWLAYRNSGQAVQQASMEQEPVHVCRIIYFQKEKWKEILR